MTEFERAVDGVLRTLRAGEVVTYGEVAREAGYPGAARAVGGFLAGSGGAYPWWRVVTSTGRLVPGHEVEHETRLRAEGVELRGGRVVSAGGVAWGGARTREVAVLHAWVDQDLCTGDGLCTDHCPELFVLLEDGISYVIGPDGEPNNDPGGAASAVPIPEGLLEHAIAAAEDCPGECIFIDDIEPAEAKS